MTIEDLADRIFQVEKALENYRQYKTAIEDLETDVIYAKQRLEKLEERDILHQKNVERLEKFVNQMIESIVKSKELLIGAKEMILDLKKSPHKCPICNGAGKKLTEAAKTDFDGILRAGLEPIVQCHSCEGSGIIWG